MKADGQPLGWPNLFGMPSQPSPLARLSVRTVAAAAAAVGVLTTVAAVLSWWPVAVAGLVVGQLLVLAAVLRNGRAASAPASGPTGVGELEQRIDALSARLVASSERTRVDVLQALRADTLRPTDHE